VSVGRWTKLVAVTWTLLISVAPVRSEPTEIQIVTQSFAPLQWDNDGNPDGYVTNFMLTVFERVGERHPVTVGSFEFMPWKRAMLTAQTTPGVMLFSLSRTPDREDKFLWLGEVSPYGQYLYQLGTKPKIDVETIADLKDHDVKIGVQDGGNMHHYLTELGLEKSGNLVPITDYKQGIEMLYLERIDLLPLTGFLAEASACKQGYDGSLLQPVVFIEDLAKPLWAVFSRGTDPALTEAVREEMSVLKKSGYLDEITELHSAKWQKLACGD